MSSLSRRDFFSGKLFSKKVNDKLDEDLLVIIGKIADFPVGAKILQQKYQLLVESFSEGLRVRSNFINNAENIFYSIKANQLGELCVNRAEAWPGHVVLSILTNEPTSFELSKGEIS
ncbi:MAG: hypothetical protein WA160_01660 [Pseudobdellovibrio sp.]